MSQIQEQSLPSSFSYSSPTPVSHPRRHSNHHRMNDYPEELSEVQEEAVRILRHVLRRLQNTQSNLYPRYGNWVSRHPRLEKFLFQCVRPQAWRFLEGRWSLDAMKQIGGGLKFEGRVVYVDGVLGLDKRVRSYVGQSSNYRFRIAQHLNFRYRRDNPSLHYHAVQQSIYNVFGILAILPSPNMGNQTLPGMDSPELLLNVLEMWFCLIFRSLPTQLLQDWVPADMIEEKGLRKEGREGVFGGLNIAAPLDHGVKQLDWLDLSEDDDELVRSYADGGRKRSEIQYVDKKVDVTGKEAQTITPGTLLAIGTVLLVGFMVISSSSSRRLFRTR